MESESEMGSGLQSGNLKCQIASPHFDPIWLFVEWIQVAEGFGSSGDLSPLS
jgi:hypothetical protein